MRSMAAVLMVALTTCGGDGPVCGDGVQDPGEQCDSDNAACVDCMFVGFPLLQVNWVFNAGAAVGFDVDGCTDMDASMVEVAVRGPVSRTLTANCSNFSVQFRDVTPGEYRIAVRVLDADGADLTASPTSVIEDYAGGMHTVTLNVPPGSWVRQYTGSFYFRLLWAGADCSDAQPPVQSVAMTLSQAGIPVELATTAGDPLDGTSAPCRPAADGTQTALAVPFGRAQFVVEGRDGDGTAQFSSSFDTFIGAGEANPEFSFDVPPLMPDAGVSDAGVPDAGAPDAT